MHIAIPHITPANKEGNTICGLREGEFLFKIAYITKAIVETIKMPVKCEKQ
jgi:hypothetical protein